MISARSSFGSSFRKNEMLQAESSVFRPPAIDGPSPRMASPCPSLFGAFPELPPPPPASGTLPVARPQLPPELQARRDRRLDLTGQWFGALFVLAFEDVETRCRFARWRAECRVDRGGCGAVVIARGIHLRRREHCGCRSKVTFDGLTLSVSAWERELRRRGIAVCRRTIESRLHKGWPVEAALTTPAARRAA